MQPLQKQKNIDYSEVKFKSQESKKIERIFFWSLVFFVVFSFFARNNFKSVKEPNPELFNKPVKTKLVDNSLIEFSQNGFDYEVKPLYEYEMSALVVNKMDYTILSLSRTSSVFPVDLCVTWGNNLKSGAYRHPSVGFHQNFRFCFGDWSDSSGFRWHEVSNNHLVIKDESLRKKALSINEGDQVRIRGKLVNVHVQSSDGSLQKYESESSSWNSSTKLGDSGAGACEVIYVEDIEIIKKGNSIFHYGFKIGAALLLSFVVWKVFGFFFELSRDEL